MYNRYIRNDTGLYERVQEGPPPGGPGRNEAGPPPGGPSWGPTGGSPGGQKEGRKGFLSGILDRLNLKNMETEDLILLLLIFLLYREGEDEELLIALGLLLIL